MATTEPDTTGVRAEDLQPLLDGRYASLRHQIRELLSRPESEPPIAMPTAEYRELVFNWMRSIAAEGLTAPGFPVQYGGHGDAGANIAGFETIAFGDLSLLVKFGVQFGLWGGAIQQLGNRTHHERYLKPTATLELIGCFAMTEAGHGSNVQQFQTTATYDRETDEFVIHTPNHDACKEYIGNAACHAQFAAVFAQLIVGGESHGVHVLVVPLRDERGNVHAGVRIEDCGEKMGLNGVDNGRIWFDHVRVPRDALLNRYGGVNDQGAYESPIEKPTKRFFTMLGALVQGRVCISGASISAAKTALTIAVRHGLRRVQFGPPDEPEVPLLDYRTHQRRLMPLLAKTYALHFAQAELLEQLHRAHGDDDETTEREQRQLESLAAGLKAASSWHATETIQTCRECCGGAGYMSVNRFAALKADTDVFTTFEGDNTVLMMLVARGLLTDYRDAFGELNPRETVLFVAEQAVETVVEQSPEGPIRDALNRLCDLYALHQIELDRGDLQEHGRLTGPRCKAITRAVNELCDQVRGDAEALVDAFGIPDRVLRAPIALR